MANYSTLFTTPDGSFTGGYTSNAIEGNSQQVSNQSRGVIQVQITSGTVLLQMRLSTEAEWFTVKTYVASIVEEAVLSPYMRVVASADAKCWLAETH